MPSVIATVLATLTVAFSLIAFVMLGVDKRRAARGKWRIREKTLHLIALLGGWPGSLLGRRVFRHKTRALKFRIIAGCIVALHVALWLGLAWWALQRSGDV